MKVERNEIVVYIRVPGIRVCTEVLKVLELFCGIGGMHYALQEAKVNFQIKAAIDINTITNSIYKHNFQESPLLQRQLQSISLAEMNKFDFNMVLMSPPCQPFTRVGLKKDDDDHRTDAFLGLLQQMESMAEPPKYILVENVKGFEESKTREKMVTFFKKLNYTFQEFLLTPLQFGIPNSRLRYYCLAKLHHPFVFPTKDEILDKIPEEAIKYLLTLHLYNADFVNLTTASTENTPGKITTTIDSDVRIDSLDLYLEKNIDLTSYYVEEKNMKYYEGLDIRWPYSRNSCCFTKRYGHYFVGSGSFLALESQEKDGLPCLRYFTPREIANVMCFPSSFGFPDSVTRKQQYKALGNSLNVYVVACLIKLLVTRKVKPDSSITQNT